MRKIYKGHSIKECLKKACNEFDIRDKTLNYEIIDETGFLITKRFILDVEIPDEYIKNDDEENTENIEEKYKFSEEAIESENKQAVEEVNKNINSDDKDGSVKVENGKIIIKDPKEDGRSPYVSVSNGIVVKIDGVEVKGKKEIYEESNIEVFFDETKASRELKISFSEDNMEAYVAIIYKPEYKYALKDKKESKGVILESEIKSQINPPEYTIQELKNQLLANNINCGIIEKNLEKCINGKNNKVLVAKGEEVVNGQDDFIELKFKTEKDLKTLKEDIKGNIDFKSIGAVEGVHKGDLLAVRHSGLEGHDGYDVTGKVKKHKPGKKLKLKVGEGCLIKDDNNIIAAMGGKPCVKSNVFYVYQLHEVRSDVDLKTGNIKFMGDINIYGSVAEGMEVECGNYLIIEKDIERARIASKGDMHIKGNVIAGKIFGGGEDVGKVKTLKDLEDLSMQLKNLISAIEEIKKYNLLGIDKKDGEIIKILIENKFKALPRICINVISDLNVQKNSYDEEPLVSLIRCKLIGIAPINIRHFSELNNIINQIDEKVIDFKNALTLPASVKVDYCQDSIIQSTGDVIITGKGEYISEITANGSIYFLNEKSVARGGSLKAKNEIKCKVVGSIAGVATKLKVEKQGHIWVDIAYQNTIFAVGNREYVLESPSKQIHAYLDKDGDLAVDKFAL